MLKDLKTAAKVTGFTLHIATSDKNIKDQLAAIVRQEDLPLAMSSWDLPVNVEFDDNGRIKNPTIKVTLLLVDKADSLLKQDLENKAEEVGNLFIKYMRNLNNHLYTTTNVKEKPITGISFTYAPKFGSGQHSGILANFTVQMNLEPDC